MTATLLGLRGDDGRSAWMAFTTLLTIIAAHAVLETARDALFLADLPVARAWLMMLIAFDAVFITLSLWLFEPAMTE